jgi:hypothetical protein
MSLNNYLLNRYVQYENYRLEFKDIILRSLVQNLYYDLNSKSKKFKKSYKILYYYLKTKTPYQEESYQYIGIISILIIFFDSKNSIYSLPSLRNEFWNTFLAILNLKNMEFTIDYLDENSLESLIKNSLRLIFESNLAEPVSPSYIIGKKSSSCLLIENPLIYRDLWRLKNELDDCSHLNENKRNIKFSSKLNQLFNQKFFLILHVIKEIYTLFNIPYLTEEKSNNFSKSFIKFNATSTSFPLHKLMLDTVGSKPDLGGLDEELYYLLDEVNFNVKTHRGSLHHLGDLLGWIIANLCLNVELMLGVSENNHFLHRIGDYFNGRYLNPFSSNNIRMSHEYTDQLIAKNSHNFILDKGERGEDCFIKFKADEGVHESLNCTIHKYASNPVFQKYAHRNIDAYTSNQLIKKLIDIGKNSNKKKLKPFFIKSIYGKFVIDVVSESNQMKNTTYEVKENKTNINFDEIQSIYNMLKNESICTKKEFRINMYQNFMAKTLSGDHNISFDYLKFLRHSKKPQWIISDVIDMHDEYRIFVVNHKVVVGTPCHRRSTPLDMYPIGRFHPGLSFSHKSKFIRMNPKTRKRVAEYIRFARKFAKEMKDFENHDKDFASADHGNYVLDVAWSNSKNSVVAIEINEGNSNNPGNIGMYATNTIKLMCAYINKKYDLEKTSLFANLLKRFAFHNVTLNKKSVRLFQKENGNACDLYYSTEKEEIENYIDKENYPLILKDNIRTGKMDSKGKNIFVTNPYLNHSFQKLDEIIY